MRFTVLASVTTVAGILFACSTESSTTNTNTGDGGASSSGGSSSGATSSSGGSSSGGTTKPAASTTEGPVTIDSDTCPAFSACGGTLDGTWDYEKGCLGDLFKDLRDQCAQLDTTGLKATVKGSVYFLAAGALERDVTTNVTGDIKFPVSCTLGQGCGIVETLLKDTFPNVKCTEASQQCTCTASRTESNTAATTYTVTGNTVKTADGDEYDFCVNGSTLTYSGKTKEAEEGVWQLKKR